MTPFARLAVLALLACAHAQYAEERAPRYIASEPKAQASTPVPILKQINRQKRGITKWKRQSRSTRTTSSTTPSEDLSITFKVPIDNDSLRQSMILSANLTAEREKFMRDLKLLLPSMGYQMPEPRLPKRRSMRNDIGHNEDGSYTYGYEAADGSFKIETKSPTGEVKGKYGYKDDTGKVRVIEYGANKYGFQPAGEGITVAPPTLVDETTNDEGLRPAKSQSGRAQYRPAPSQAIDYDYSEEPAPPRPAPRPQPQYRAPAPQPQPQPQLHRAPPPPQLNRAPPPPPQQQYRAPQPTQQQYRPSPQPQQYRQSQGPVPPKPAFFAGASPASVEDNFFNPEPQQRQYKPNPAPQYQQFAQPKPQIEYSQEYSEPSSRQPQFHSQANFQPQQRATQPFSMLDQLLKEYSLPSNGAAPLHDITFGTY